MLWCFRLACTVFFTCRAYHMKSSRVFLDISVLPRFVPMRVVRYLKCIFSPLSSVQLLLPLLMKIVIVVICAVFLVGVPVVLVVRSAFVVVIVARPKVKSERLEGRFWQRFTTCRRSRQAWICQLQALVRSRGGGGTAGSWIYAFPRFKDSHSSLVAEAVLSCIPCSRGAGLADLFQSFHKACCSGPLAALDWIRLLSGGVQCEKKERVDEAR